MNKTLLFVIAFVPLLLISGRASAGYADDYSSSVPQEHSWTLEYTDPVELAAEVISSSSSFWNPLGYRVMRMKYTVGRFAAQHGFGYLLLASPRLSVSMVNGGFYGVASTVSKDLLLNLVEESVGSPRELCEEISNSVISDGLSDYERAYEIARKFIDEGDISREEAIEFLEKRWSIYKIVYAEALYNDAISLDYSISSQMRDAAIQEVTHELQSVLDIGSSIPIAEYAFFVKDLTSILANRNVGLMDYQPYLDFETRMEGLNALMLDEMERFGSTAGNWDPEDVIDFNGLQWLVGPDQGTTWDEANDWVNGLGGDWRIPTRRELIELWNAGISCENPGAFETVGTWIWSVEQSAWDFLTGTTDTRQWNPYNFPDATRAIAVRQPSYESSYTITPEGIAGITEETTPQDLIEMFVEEDIEYTTVYLDEGYGLDGTIINAGTGNELTVVWENGAIKTIMINTPGPRTAEGIGVGSSLTEVEDVIGEFMISGFYWQYAGFANLSDTSFENYYMRFSPAGTFQGDEYLGDSFYPSSDMRQFDMIIREMRILF